MKNENVFSPNRTPSSQLTEKENGLRSMAESIISKEDKQNVEALNQLSSEEVCLIVHELKVYQTELEMQNDELRKIQLELEQMKSKYFDLYDLAPVGYLVVSEKGLILETNLTAAVMFGETKESLRNKPLTHFLYIEDQDDYYVYRKDLFKNKLPQNCELRMVKKSDEIFWAHLKSTLVVNEESVSCWVVISDVSARKEAEEKLVESEEKHRLLVTQMSQGMVVLQAVLDSKGKIVDFIILDSNESFEKMTGLRQKSVSGRKLRSVIPQIEDSWFIKYEQVALTGKPLSFENYSRAWEKYYEVMAYSPKPNHVAAIFSDITKRKTIEVQLKQNRNELLVSQRIAQLGTWRIDALTNDVVWSEELFKMYGVENGYPPPTLTEHKKLFDVESWNRLLSAIEETKKTGACFEMELELASGIGDGPKRWIWIRGEGLKDSNGKVFSLWGASQDITERKINEDKLLFLSTHDYLTGLNNRRYFEERLKRLDTEAHLPLSVIMFDVNGLKLVNDSFGHDFGDLLLKKAAETIKKVSREGDLVARLGGDEFALVMPRTSLEDTIKISNQIKALTSKIIVANVELSLSYGYDTKTNMAQFISDTVVNAENHMYKHKLFERTSIKSKTIDLIMSNLFEKCKDEAHHSNKVSRICQEIAKKLNLNANRVNQMKTVGLMHDIGKIGVDERILNKSGKLTNSERLEIERHPEIGWRLLSSTNEFADLAQFVIHHHEKWDGSGYPNGLKGKSIELESRIIAVAEAFDAMTRKRPFEPPLTKREAISELERCSGTHFDPLVVKVFLELVLPENNQFFA